LNDVQSIHLSPHESPQRPHGDKLPAGLRSDPLCAAADHHRAQERSAARRPAIIEFHEFKKRKYVFGAWGTRTDWYRNIEADPHITIQTWRGAESVIAHRLATQAEYEPAFDYAMSNPSMRAVMKSFSFKLTRDEFLARKEHFTFVTFDPTSQPTPEPLHADL
jgi:hypothetical protein